ncbi:MAG: hypothetical protein RIF41_35505 [Polyangiaceae bacterium]
MRNTLTSEAFEDGNLAALEDDEPPVSSVAQPLSEGSRPPAISAPPSVPAPMSDPRISAAPASMPDSMPGSMETPPAKPGSTTAVKALLLFVIAAGTAAAVWFSGLL